MSKEVTWGVEVLWVNKVVWVNEVLWGAEVNELLWALKSGTGAIALVTYKQILYREEV